MGLNEIKTQMHSQERKLKIIWRCNSKSSEGVPTGDRRGESKRVVIGDCASYLRCQISRGCHEPPVFSVVELVVNSICTVQASSRLFPHTHALSIVPTEP